MASLINASTSPAGIVQTADGTGILALQTAGTTAVTIDASQNVAFAKGFTVGATAAPAFSAYQSTGQTGISSLTETKITFTTEEFDTNNNFASSTFTPTVAGYYQINAQVTMTSAATNAVLLTAIWKNGARIKSGSVSTGSTYLYPQANTATIVYMNGTTDYLEVYVLGSSGGGSFGTYATGASVTYFQAAMIRSA